MQFKCELCPEKFTEQFSLLLHFEQVHVTSSDDEEEEEESDDNDSNTNGTGEFPINYEDNEEDKKDLCDFVTDVERRLQQEVELARESEKRTATLTLLRRLVISFPKQSPVKKKITTKYNKKEEETGTLSKKKSRSLSNCKNLKENGKESRKDKVVPKKIAVNSCGSCGRGYFSVYKLQAHIIKFGHVANIQNRRPFQCVICKKECITMDHLKRHRKSMHGPSIKKFKCRICQMEFALNDELAEHMRCDHPNVDMMQCVLCQKLFSSGYNLSRHMKICGKSNPKKLNCSYCTSTFSRSDNLGVHIKVFHKDKLRKD